MVCIQCLPAAFFTIAGAYQMTMWALGKHRYLGIHYNRKCLESRSGQICRFHTLLPPLVLCCIPTSPRNYKKEFKDYPRRKAIIPFLI